MQKPNIYLDIDGVLLANEYNAANHTDEFLQYVIENYNVYWLTTHCRGGVNRTIELLTPVLRPETVKLLSKIEETDWTKNKTEAINFAEPFLWFDDDLYDEEREELLAHNALDSWVEVDLHKDEDALKTVLEKL